MKLYKLTFPNVIMGIFKLINKAYGSSQSGSGISDQFIPPGVYQTIDDVPYFSSFIAKISERNRAALVLQAGMPEHDFLQSIEFPSYQMRQSSDKGPARSCYFPLGHYSVDAYKTLKSVTRLMETKDNNTVGLSINSILLCVLDGGSVTMRVAEEVFPMAKIRTPDFIVEKPVEVPDDGWYTNAEPLDAIDSVTVSISGERGSVDKVVRGLQAPSRFDALKIYALKLKTRCYQVLWKARRVKLDGSKVMIRRDRDLVTYLALDKRYIKLQKGDRPPEQGETTKGQVHSRKRKNVDVDDRNDAKTLSLQSSVAEPNVHGSPTVGKLLGASGLHENIISIPGQMTSTNPPTLVTNVGGQNEWRIPQSDTLTGVLDNKGNTESSMGDNYLGLDPSHYPSIRDARTPSESDNDVREWYDSGEADELLQLLN